MRIAFVINGNIRKLDAVKAEIKSTFNNHELEIFVSEYALHYTVLIHDALAQNFKNFVLVGGDGSVNEGINAIIDYFKIGDNYDWHLISSINIAVYPAGSGNDFVKTLYGVNAINIHTLKKLFDTNSTGLIDIGVVDFINKSKQLDRRFFINITDVGVGGDTVQRKDNVPKWLGADFSYMWAITTSITQYKPLPMVAIYDDMKWTGKAMSFVIANGNFFGNGLCVAPDASLTSGLFDITIVGDISLMEYIKNLGKIKKGIKIEHPEVHYLRSKTVQIESSSNDQMTIDMDGEFIGYAPMTLTCLASKLSFYRF